MTCEEHGIGWEITGIDDKKYCYQCEANRQEALYNERNKSETRRKND